MLPLGQIIHHHKLSYTDNVSQHQLLQLPLFSTSSKTSKTGCHQLSQTELLAVAPEWLLYWSWCGRIFPAPVRWRNYPQPGCHLVRYPPVVIIYQIHSDWPLRWNHHSHLFDLPNRGLDRLQYVQDSPARVHTWQHIIPTWISNKILLTYKSLYAITPGTFQTFSAKRLLSFWVLGAVARTLWKHTPLSALKCLDYIFKKQLIKNCHVLTEAFDLGSLKCAI